MDKENVVYSKIYMMGYFLVLIKDCASCNKMDALEDIMLNEINKSQEDILYDSTYVKHLK